MNWRIAADVDTNLDGRVSLHIRAQLSRPLIFLEQLDGRINAWDGAAGQRRAPHQHVGRGEVVEQTQRVLVARARRGRHDDVDDATRQLYGNRKTQYKK